MPNFHSTNILGDLRITGILNSTVATGTAPFVIASTTLVSNLNADLLDSVHASSFARVDSASTFTTIPAFNGGTSETSAPFTVDSTFKVSNLNADLLDNQHGSYYAAASSLSNYLPLSGGNIVATSSNYCPLSVSILASDEENNIQEWFRSGVAAPYVYINNSGQIASNLLTAAPFIVSSTTRVDNLNAATAGEADKVKTITTATAANFYPTFVDANNASATAETVYTDGGIYYNPSTDTLTVANLTVTGTTTTNNVSVIETSNGVIFEGTTADGFETTL